MVDDSTGPIVVAPNRRRIRLPAAAYRESGSAWLITIVCAGRWPLLADHEPADTIASVLIERMPKMGLRLDAWCVMPDHVHAVVQVCQGDLVGAVADVKSRSTQAWWALGHRGTLWQRSFHDYGLRRSGEWREAVRYVLTNPERTGLVADWWTFPFVGGDVLDDP